MDLLVVPAAEPHDRRLRGVQRNTSAQQYRELAARVRPPLEPPRDVGGAKGAAAQGTTDLNLNLNLNLYKERAEIASGGGGGKKDPPPPPPVALVILTAHLVCSGVARPREGEISSHK